MALVLAAGRGRRFGSDKRVAVLPSGERMLAQTLARALAAFRDVWVVLRVEDDPAALGVDERVTVVRAERADEGMGFSLAAGVKALERTGFEAVAVMLGDMPWVEVGTLERLRDLAASERIVVPEFEGQRGHPVVFARTYWERLRGLQGDQGGKRVMQENAQDCRVVKVDDKGVVRDLDMPVEPGLADE
ncbi:nucleotidyltransferase family protein [Pseudomonas sp. 148P]|uniref:Nucleotidyltransferase family protein n=1 Tax=Pseudomonas ulcerans TaxID=3115852 RepID=A0ABU7HTD9_9PSED|nr:MULTISPECIES: nucleotidyltransferase family protein [unclassified Pseudomonas]MEE1924953.1 nucleotidyltransferase family protein [Pseudomonas sp. 147P]MEE1934726.1 nucleotidyltransferase family protein [Pseudomonas sp. 148P]